MDNFPQFGTLVRNNWNKMVKSETYVVSATRDQVWDHYLASFPEGTNPIFRERTEHDCSCCRHFVKNVGNVISIKDGEVTTVWDGGEKLPTPYREVAAAMAEFIRGFFIENLYRSTPSHSKFGAQSTNELLESGKVKKWNHFMVEVPRSKQRDDLGTFAGQTSTTAQVFARGLDSISEQALQDILDLIRDKALYRGDEFKKKVREFLDMKRKYAKLNSDEARNKFIWENINSPAARFKNTAIGTLAEDLTSGRDIDESVGSFEAKVAPENYKRPTALITPRMIEDALKTLRELDLEPAINRRHAKLSDVSVNNVLFVDNHVRGLMRDGLAGLLMEEAKPKTPDLKSAQEISIDDFMSSILPKARSVEVLVENKHLSNFVSVTAPQHEDTGGLFKWNNDFAWSYDGEVTDSIRQRVKKAGGRVDNALMRVSLAWFNHDDLDIHVYEPNGNHIFFGNKGGKLDVDMNAGGRMSREPVENVSWMKKPADGTYRVEINNYSKRENIDLGFDLEVQSGHQVWTFSYSGAVKGTVKALELVVKNGAIVDVTVAKGVTPGAGVSQEKWGIDTHSLVRVNTMMLSPNFWDDQEIGNKHFFFILDGCQNPDPVRGIYNEFLSPAFDKHRKVFEVLGSKTKCAVTDEQLSGLGFSSTRNDDVTVFVRGDKIQKPYKIQF